MVESTNMKKAFTLVELLIVMVIIGILATIGLGSFRTAQMKGRDAQRKSDLRQISEALELFYSDYGKYPDYIAGEIAACPYNPVTSTGASCTWGVGELTDGKTIYFKILPIDPSPTYFEYIYQVDPTRQKFKLFARLENLNDKQVDLSISPAVICGSGETCNFAITSTNTTTVDE